MESVCSVPLPGTCWVKVPSSTAELLLSVAASGYHFSMAPELCSAALGLAGHSAQVPETSLFCISSSIFLSKGLQGYDLMGRRKKGRRLVSLSGNNSGKTPYFLTVCVYLG